MPCPLRVPFCSGGTSGAGNPCPLGVPICPINTNRFPRPRIGQELDNLCQTALTAAEVVANQDPELAERIRQQVQTVSQLQNETLDE